MRLRLCRSTRRKAYGFPADPFLPLRLCLSIEAQPQYSFVDFNGKPEAYRTVLRQSRENKYQLQNLASRKQLR
jgi:hypothetical protein